MTRIAPPIRYSREELLRLNPGPRVINPVAQAPNIATLFNNRVGSCKPIDKCDQDKDDDFNPPAPQMGF